MRSPVAAARITNTARQETDSSRVIGFGKSTALRGALVRRTRNGRSARRCVATGLGAIFHESAKETCT